MKRRSLLNALQYAGFHDDNKSFVQLFSENRINYQIAKDAFNNGKRAKKDGARCNCFICKAKL